VASDKKLTVEMARGAVSSEPRLDLLLNKIFANKDCSKTVSISSELTVGIDIGGTNIRAAVIRGNDGKIVGNVVKRKVEDRSPEGFLRLLGDVYDHLVTAIQRDLGKFIPVAIGVGQPGHIDEQGCVSKMANYPNWGDQAVPVKSFLLERSGCSRVVMFNDADTHLAAEVYYGAGRLSETVAMLTVVRTVLNSQYIRLWFISTF
jgi:glucokinase